MDKVYQIPKSEINKIVRDFIDMPGIEVVHDLNMKTLISYWPEVFKDYGDAIIATLCKNTKGSLIVTGSLTTLAQAVKGVSISFILKLISLNF